VLSDEWANSTEYVLEICVYDGAQVLLNSGPHNTGCPLMWESKGASQSVRLLFISPVLHLSFHSSPPHSFFDFY